MSLHKAKLGLVLVALAGSLLAGSPDPSGSGEPAWHVTRGAGTEWKVRWTKADKPVTCASSGSSPWVLEVRVDGTSSAVSCLENEASPAPVIDTACLADLDKDGKMDLVLVYSSPGYLAEYSASGVLLFAACLSGAASGSRDLPYFSEYLGGNRVAQDGTKQLCDDPFCSPRAIVAEVSRIAALSGDQVLTEVRAYAEKCYRSKVVKGAGRASALAVDMLNLLSATNAGLYNDLGYFMEQAGDYSQAVQVLTKVVEVAPDRTVAYLNLGDALAGSGDKAKAKANYQRYVELMEKAGKKAKVPERVRKAVVE